MYEMADGQRIHPTSAEHAKHIAKQYPKSKKLRLYLGHTFEAVAYRSNQHCAVCKQKITKYFAKGYQCRGKCA